jgi:hypothetical protein
MLLSKGVRSVKDNKLQQKLINIFRNYFQGIGGTSSVDNLPYSTLSFANGPGYKQPEKDGTRYDISGDNMSKYINKPKRAFH